MRRFSSSFLCTKIRKAWGGCGRAPAAVQRRAGVWARLVGPLRGDLAGGDLVGALAGRVDLGAAAAEDALGVLHVAALLHLGLVLGVDAREQAEIGRGFLDFLEEILLNFLSVV